MSPVAFPPVLPSARFTYTSGDGTVRVVLDTITDECWMECTYFAKTAEVRTAHAFVVDCGFELISEDEAEPEEQEDGFLRILCRPVKALTIVHPDVLSLAAGGL